MLSTTGTKVAEGRQSERDLRRVGSGMKQSSKSSSAPVDERREHRRLEIRLPVELRKIGGEGTVLVRTITQNISTGGMYLELDRADFETGDRLSVELTVPPAEGVSPYTGHATCTAEVLRVFPAMRGKDDRIERFGIAAKFLDRLRINY